MNAAALRRLERLEAEAVHWPAPASDAHEWLHWMTCDELIQMEQISRSAEEQGLKIEDLVEAVQHKALALYSAAMARMLEAPPEVRADPGAVAAYVREIEDRGRKRWL